jgi:hypothetical protein
MHRFDLASFRILTQLEPVLARYFFRARTLWENELSLFLGGMSYVFADFSRRSAPRIRLTALYDHVSPSVKRLFRRERARVRADLQRRARRRRLRFRLACAVHLGALRHRLELACPAVLKPVILAVVIVVALQAGSTSGACGAAERHRHCDAVAPAAGRHPGADCARRAARVPHGVARRAGRLLQIRRPRARPGHATHVQTRDRVRDHGRAAVRADGVPSRALGRGASHVRRARGLAVTPALGLRGGDNRDHHCGDERHHRRRSCCSGWSRCPRCCALGYDQSLSIGTVCASG